MSRALSYLAPCVDAPLGELSKHGFLCFCSYKLIPGAGMPFSVTPAIDSRLISQLHQSSPTLQESPHPASFVKSVIRSSRRSRVWRCTNRQSMREWSSTVSSALTARRPSQTWKCTFRRNTPLRNPCTSSRFQQERFNTSKKHIWETMLLIKSIALWDKRESLAKLGIWISFVSHCILKARMSHSYWKLLLIQL